MWHTESAHNLISTLIIWHRVKEKKNEEKKHGMHDGVQTLMSTTMVTKQQLASISQRIRQR